MSIQSQPADANVSPTSRGSLLVLMLTVMIDLIGFGMIIPLIPLYTRCLGQSEIAAGVLFASYSLMQFVFSPVLGRLSDRIGRRPILLFSLLGNTGSMLLFGAATSFSWLLVARILGGGCTANISVAQAYIADVSEPSKRAARMGLIGAAFGVGFIFGPFLGGELAPYGLHVPPFVVAGLSLLNAVLTYFLLPEPNQRTLRPKSSLLETIRHVSSAPGLGSIFVILFVQIFAFSMLEMSFSFFVVDRMVQGTAHAAVAEVGALDCMGTTSESFSVVGRVFAFIGIISVIVQGGLSGPLNRRFGSVRLIQVGVSLVGLGMLMMPWISHSTFGPISWWGLWAVFLGVVAIIATGQAMISPALNATLSTRTPAEHQGAVFGSAQSIGALARTFGPFLAGTLYDYWGSGMPYWVGGALMGAVSILAWASLREVR